MKLCGWVCGRGLGQSKAPLGFAIKLILTFRKICVISYWKRMTNFEESFRFSTALFLKLSMTKRNTWPSTLVFWRRKLRPWIWGEFCFFLKFLTSIKHCSNPRTINAANNMRNCRWPGQLAESQKFRKSQSIKKTNVPNWHSMIVVEIKKKSFQLALRYEVLSSL